MSHEAPVPPKEVTFTVSLQVKPGLEGKFLDLLMPVLDAMRHEPSFIHAILHQDPEDPAHFMLYETWADMDDLMQVQVYRDYRKAYTESLSEILREPREIKVWRRMRSDFAFFAAGER